MAETEKMSSPAHTLREAAERFTREGRPEARQAMQQATEMATEAYEEAGNWLQENYGKAIAFVGVMTLAGVVGYMMGRNSLSSSSDISSRNI